MCNANALNALELHKSGRFPYFPSGCTFLSGVHMKREWYTIFNLTRIQVSHHGNAFVELLRYFSLVNYVLANSLQSECKCVPSY